MGEGRRAREGREAVSFFLSCVLRLSRTRHIYIVVIALVGAIEWLLQLLEEQETLGDYALEVRVPRLCIHDRRRQASCTTDTCALPVLCGAVRFGAADEPLPSQSGTGHVLSKSARLFKYDSAVLRQTLIQRL